MERCVLFSALALAVAMPALAQPPSAEVPAQPAARAEVLVLGVYHMANPGRDIFNMKADDVLAPKRQAEIGQLIEVLKGFRRPGRRLLLPAGALRRARRLGGR